MEFELDSIDGKDLQQHISRLMAVLETAWQELRRIVPGLPSVVLVVLSAREYSRREHFAMESWRKRHQENLLHELAVHPGMFEYPHGLLITLLHEAAHALLWECRKVGCTLLWSFADGVLSSQGIPRRRKRSGIGSPLLEPPLWLLRDDVASDRRT